MADLNYQNPFALVGNQDPVPENPFWSGMMASQNQRMAAPFIDQARQMGDMNLQQKAIETGEFASPDAVRQRLLERQAKSAASQEEIQTIPYRGKKERAQIDQEIRGLAPDMDKRIAQAQELERQARTAPAREMYTHLGQMYDTISQADEKDRPFLYLSGIQRMKDMGVEVPPHFAQYDPRILPDLGAIRHSQLFTPEQIGKERLMQIETGSAEKRSTGTNAANVQIGEGHDLAHVTAAGITRDAAETPAKAEARVRRELRKNPGDEDARRELRGYIEERFDQRFQRDGLGQMLQVQASNGDQASMNKYLTYREQQKARLFMNEGIYGEIDAQGRDWVMRAIESNPNMGVENIIQEGQRRGKIGKGKK